MVRRVTYVTTDVLDVRIAFSIRVTRIGEIGTTLTLTNNRSTLRRNAVYTHSCIPDDGIYTFLRNVRFYKSHTVYHPRRRYSS
jgi:hypothetical protein